MLGWVAGNVQTGYVKAATYDEMVEDVKKSSPAEVQFLDMRDRNEIERDGVPKLPISDAKWVNIPFDNLRSHLGELDSKKKTYLLCHSGLRSYLGCRVLQQHGFEAYNVQGGMLQVPTSERAKL